MISSTNNKIVLIGDAGVGKTSLVYWLVNRKPLCMSNSTIGAAYFTKNMLIKDKIIRLNIWDTAGQERFRSFVEMYCRNSVVCICVFDITNLESYTNINYWIDYYKKSCDSEKSIIYIVANKCDTPESTWMISHNEIIDIARSYKCEYYLVNCINGNNIDNLFTNIADHIDKINNTDHENMNSIQDKNTVTLSQGSGLYDNTKQFINKQRLRFC